jgi:signal transduction histidine kinase
MQNEIIKVLLIEDNPGDARLIRELLAEANGALFHVEVAGCLADGLERIAKGDIDVILLDLYLPDSNGIDTLLRAKVQAPEVPIVVLTGLKDETVGVKAVHEGAQDYLIKGQVDGNLLMRCIRYAIERKRASEELQLHYDREKELRLKLEDEIKRRVEFTRALVHELKTPITPILASSDLLTELLHEGPLLKLAKNIREGALTMNNRIDTLLDLAKGELGMLQLKIDRLDPLPLLQDIATEMSPVATRGGISLILDVPCSLPLVWIDSIRLRQVIQNLLVNALKWTPQGGKVTLGAEQNDNELIVKIQDTGPGVAAENQQALFEAYYRVESDRQHLDGLGLGLALCKTIVELHGGNIWMQSQEGKGSIFSFSVPLKGNCDLCLLA